MDLEDVELLTSDQGRSLLGQLPPYDRALAISLTEGLRRRGIDPKLAAAALTQSRLRAKAGDKFGHFADQMLFTDQGLQQATRLEVAAHHAERYLAAGIETVVDLTGGIGGDALAMAALGLRVIVYERDPVTAAVARANLQPYPAARVFTADSLDQRFDSTTALFADPSRRTPTDQRVFDPARYEPPLARLLELARDHPLGIKVAPGIPHRAIPAGAEAQWVSVDGDVVEAGLWFGPLRSDVDPGDRPRRTALVIRQGRAHRLAQGRHRAGEHSPTSAQGYHTDDAADHARQSARLPTGPLNEFIYEPDGAVIRASLIAEAAATLGPANLVSPRIAYITSPVEAPGNAFLTGYRVIDAFPFGLKPLRAYLREHGIGQIVVKKRGTAVDPADLRKRLRAKGDGAATVILTRLGAQQSVVIAQRLPGVPTPADC
ncbi:MAG: class I SAM-dependent methyltransferase [Bifidobacteriaceae bacterium]|jgi:hypothetical protein|nr:class I SAM-dependent methyltransferase [Bifidobacteriaceae bacterium]